MGPERAHLWRQYLAALEEERRKIQVFSKELPLCLELVTQTIESYRKLLGGGAEELSDPEPRGGEEVSEDAKEKPSVDHSGEEENIQKDWLRSAQLWHQQPKDTTKDDGKAAEGSDGSDGCAARDTQGSRRKARRSWLPELHHSFVRALEQLGGSEVATPKQIRELMNVEGLTNDEVKSHLQKYRLHAKRPRSPSSAAVESIDTSGSRQPPPPVVFGLWMPPSEYAAIAAAAMASGFDGMQRQSQLKRQRRLQRRAADHQIVKEANFFL